MTETAKAGAGNGDAAPAAGAAANEPPVEVAPAVVPFWQRMPRFFLFPLQRAPLLRNLTASAALCVAAAVFFSQIATAPLRSSLLLVLAACGSSLYVAQYAFLVIERTSAGYLDTRGYPIEEGRVDWRRPVKMFLVLVLVPIVIGVVGALFLGGTLTAIVLLAFTLLLPASVMVLSMTDSFADAVNPARCAQTALAIGPPYLLLCLFLLMLFIGSQQMLGVLLPHPPAGAHAGTPAAPPHAPSMGFVLFAFFVIGFVGNYFTVLTCVLIGYAMYQFAGALGIAVVGPGDAASGRRTTSAAHARRVRESMVGKLVAAGEIKEAIALISEDLSERPSDLALHMRLHTLLLHEGSQTRIEDHAQKLLEMHLAAGNTREALALYGSTRALVPTFMPRDAARIVDLAGAAIDASQPALAAELVRGFDRRFPGHARIPDVYLIGARVMLQAGRDADAQGLLRHVVNTYKESPAAVQARRYLERFDLKKN